jgi:DNA topoisomerase-1
MHPETREPIEAGIGRFGPYVKTGGVFASLDRDDDVLAVGINRAVDVLAKKLASVRTLGAHPKDREPVLVRKGRFGPYAQHNGTVANLPRDRTMDDITLAEAVTLLAEKGKPLKARGAAGRKGGAKGSGAKASGAKVSGTKAPGVKTPGVKAPVVKSEAAAKPAKAPKQARNAGAPAPRKAPAAGKPAARRGA